MVLAHATNNLAAAFASINEQYPNSDTLRKLLLKLLLKFSGEQQDDDVLQQIMDEATDPATESTVGVGPRAYPVDDHQPSQNGRPLQEIPR
jgi:rhamnogalacturonyl hydrolase YesR